MGRNRFCYLAGLAGTVVFYIAYRQWLGWLLLVALLCLPVLSLLVSLPALFTLKLKYACPSVLPLGSDAMVELSSRCAFPLPVYDCRVEVVRTITAERFSLRLGDWLPTEHCGTLVCHVKKAWAYDYLGLFRFHLGKIPDCRVTVRPTEIPATELPRLQRRLPIAWKPKSGGGFAENHELRLYRPGDSLNQIHWKLSAKAQKLIIREPMVPVGRQAVVGLCICGTPQELDRKFGRLLGVCRRLLMLQIPYEIGAYTGEGLRWFSIDSEAQLQQTVDDLLGMPPMEQEQEIPLFGGWMYRIGGDAHD